MADSKYKILYIDDEPDNLRTFKATFKWDYDIFVAKSAFEGFDVLEENEIHLIISDQRMAGLSGVEFFKKILKKHPEPVRIILTGYSELNTVIKTINECGIYKYMTKPWDELGMKQTIEKALEFYQLRKDKEVLIQQLKSANKKLTGENTYLKEEIKQVHNFEEILTNNNAFRKSLKILERLAFTNTTALIRGETGTGKELIARAIHRLSKRADKSFIKVNCAAIPEHLIESEFFGHERGAFTGAIQKRIGRFELADGGTIFLDEIGELPINLQSKLLRVLQEGEFERIGGNKTTKVNVRIIAATNRNLEEAILDGSFRDDLFYRLNVFPITCPPLRKRKDDIPLLAKHFLKKFESNIGRKIKSIGEDCMKKLKGYNYPGNIRELENLVERFMITSNGDKLDLSQWNPVNADLSNLSNEFLPLLEVEKRHITVALQSSNWKIFGDDGAAKKLGMNPKTLSWRIKKEGIKRPASI